MTIKNAVTVSLLIALIALLASTYSVAGYVLEINASGTVETVVSGDTFNLTSGAIIKLADIDVSEMDSNTKDYLVNVLKIEGSTVYLQIDSKNESAATNQFYCVAYTFDAKAGTYTNINELLVKTDHASIKNDVNDFNPYLWQIEVPQSGIEDNSVIDSATFTQNRLALLSSYNSQTLTHATLLVTITLGLVASIFGIYSKHQENQQGNTKKLLVVIVFAFVIGLIAYILFRLFFWSWMSSQVLGVLPSEALNANTSSIAIGIQTHLTNAFITVHPLGFFYYWIVPFVVPIAILSSILICNLLFNLPIHNIYAFHPRLLKANYIFLIFSAFFGLFFTLINANQDVTSTAFIVVDALFVEVLIMMAIDMYRMNIKQTRK